jgi:hypothetical protein
VRSIKAYEGNPFKFKYSRGTSRATEKERAVPCLDVARWVSAYWPNRGGGRQLQVGSGRSATGAARTEYKELCVSV